MHRGRLGILKLGQSSALAAWLLARAELVLASFSGAEKGRTMKKGRWACLGVVPLAALMFGCVAIPVGKQTFTAEFKGPVRPAEEPATKEYGPSVAVSKDSANAVRIGLAGRVVASQPQRQHWQSVTVAKQKVVAFGLAPQAAQHLWHPKKALDVAPGYHDGHGNYSSSVPKGGAGGKSGGALLTQCTLGLLSTPFAFVYGIFGPFEHDNHFLGEVIDTKTERSYSGGRTIINTTRIRDSTKLDLLQHFTPAQRKQMGLWTWRDDKEHPHNTFWHGFCVLWAGMWKYCNYVIRDPVDIDKTEPAPARVTAMDCKVRGPYAVTLFLPDIGYEETRDIPAGETEATFPGDSIIYAANGRTNVPGRVKFRPPPGGWDEIADEDGRALLEAAMGKTWNVQFALPASASSQSTSPLRTAQNVPHEPTRVSSPSTTTPERPLYAITAIEPASAGILVVRVHVEDTSRTFEVDRLVRPEVIRLFREQFASGANANRREMVRWLTEDNGQTIVYRAGFAPEH